MRWIFKPSSYFNKVYSESLRSLEFKAESLESWTRWRSELRKVLVNMLGGFPDRCPLEATVLWSVERDGFLMEKVVFQSRPGLHAPMYLLLPKGVKGRVPAVLALHGHGYGKDEISGIEEDGSFRDKPAGYQMDFAVELVRRGFVVAAPDQFGFGERRNDEDVKRGRRVSSCHLATVWAFMLGGTMVGFRVWDAIRVVDYLQTRSEVDPDRIGCIGISGGGTTTLFTSALDDRVKVTVVSGYLCTFKDSILAMQHCICNFIPGILKYAEMPDIAALIAPKPLLIEAGKGDKIFPVKGVMKAYGLLKRVYGLLGVPERLDIDMFEGGHEISGAKAYPWLKKWLRVKKPETLLKPGRCFR